jgi:two-component system, OmpR family, phosphate regulon response regulator PhoB
VYRYDDLSRLIEALDASTGQALPTPPGMVVRDGEWVLALFEFRLTSRATAAAGRGAVRDEGLALVFERRDWERLRDFATARIEPVAPPQVSGERPSAPRLSDSLRSTAAWERSSDPPAEPPIDDAKTDETEVAPSPAVKEDEPVRTPRRLRGEGSRVLVVDDDLDLRDVVAAMLESVGLRVTAVGSAEEALEAARAEEPDLIMLDWNLPGMSGIELCRLIRNEARLAHLPVLFLTAHSATQDMVQAFAAGADDYVVKPFRAAELGARIFGLLRRTTRSAASVSP